MAQNREIDSIEIKKKLQKLFPKFKFSVTRSTFAGGHSVSVHILSGNIKPYKDGMEEDYTTGLEYSDNYSKFTDEMNAFVKKVKATIEEVGSYNNRHGSSWMHLSLGTYGKPYVYTSSSSRSTSTISSRGERRSSFDYGELLGSGHGWKLYGVYLEDRDAYVYNLVKDKDTKPNREKWDEIRGLIYTQEGFKWTPKSQTFQKWGKIDKIEEVASNLFRILGQYYKQEEGQQMPMPTPSGMLRDITDEEAREFADAIMESDTINFERVGAKSGYDIYMYADVQNKYVMHMKISLMTLLSSSQFKYLLSENIKVASLEKVYKIIEKDNYAILNNFLSLYGFYGANKQREAILDYEKYPTKSLKPFETEEDTQTPTTTPNDEIKFARGNLLIYKINGNINLITNVVFDKEAIVTKFYDSNQNGYQTISFDQDYWREKIVSGEVVLIKEIEKGDTFQYGEDLTYYKVYEVDDKNKTTNYDIIDGEGYTLDNITADTFAFKLLLISNPFRYLFELPSIFQPQESQKEKLEKAIKGLQYLADKGNEKAVKAIKGLKYLLNK